MIKNPKKTSRNLILLLKKIGSINAVKKAPVLMVTRAIDTFETLIAIKNATQCSAIKKPPIEKFNKLFELTFKFNFLYLIHI